MRKVNRLMTAIIGAAMLAEPMAAYASLSKTGVTVSGSDIPDSVRGRVSYSDTYDPIKWIKPGTDGRNGSGNDPWRNGLVTGNGENGLLEDGAPENGVLIFQNIQFNFPSNDQRETPELASVMEDVKKTIINGGEPSSDSSNAASKKLTRRAAEWSNNNGLTTGSWQLKNTYTFHPGMQLRLRMNGLENGAETSFYRYTDYETAEIGSVWTDKKGTWERKSFSSREDNVTTTSVKAKDGSEAFSIKLSIDDISDMSSENKMSGSLDDLRYKKFYKRDGNELYIGSVVHYPSYANSELKNGGFAGAAKLIVNGENARITVTDGSAPTDDRTDEQKSNGVPDETVINVSGAAQGEGVVFNAAPEILIENAEEVIIVTKSARDKNMCAYDEFAAMTDYELVNKLISDTKAAADKYTENGAYSYESALAPHAAKHGEIFKRTSVDFNADESDRALTNEKLIAKAKSEGTGAKTLNPAMLERLYYNGRYANICCSDYQVPRLGGMWTGAWKVEWSGDYTTDANINLQVAGNNIGAMPESSQGFINFILRTVTDWEINAKQVYGIDDAIFAPTRIDGDRAMVVHFNESFPGHIWNSGASWLLLPIYEYWQCCGNQQIPVAADVLEMLRVTDNTYNMAEQWYSSSETNKVNGTVYNLRNTLGLTDERAERIIEQGYFDLEQDILFPLLIKTCNFYTGLLSPEYYTKDGKAYYEAGKTALAEDESYLFVPSYSPENRPNGYGGNSYLQLNAVMDISAARDCFNMAADIAASVGESADGNVMTADTAKWAAYAEKLPPYLYEPTGELKEWAISDYGEAYGHRHISQLYGLWPGYEANNDRTLFNAAKTLIETKNTYPSTDNVAGHSWVHKGLIMARAKSGSGVRDAILPTVSQDMHYNSMMTAHNTSGNQAYCTDTTITTPAILTESLLYSDANTIEVLPALLPELENGGSISGLKARTGDDVESITWNSDSVTVKLNAADKVNVKCGKAFRSVTVNGEAAEITEDENGEPCIAVSGDAEVVFTFADIDNGTYTISDGGKNMAPEKSVDGSAVKTSAETDDKTKWNLTRRADGTYTVENVYHGRYLANDGENVYMKRTASDGESVYWTIGESGYLMSVSGKYLYLDGDTFKLGSSGGAFSFTPEEERLTEYSADSITVSTDADLSESVNPGTRVSFTASVSPEAAQKKALVWTVRAKDGSELSKTSITDGVLKIGADAVSKTLIVTARSEDGACVSNETEVRISDIVQGEQIVTASEDVFVSGWSNSTTSDKDTNYSDRQYLQTTQTAGSDKKHTLLRFELPRLGGEVGEILSAELILTFKEQSEPGGTAYYAYGYDGEWSEATATWNSLGFDSYSAGAAIAEGSYDSASKQMIFELTEDYIRKNAGKTVSLLIDSPAAKNVKTYWCSRETDSAPVINISYKVNTENLKAVYYGPYWAADVTNNQGSKGDIADNEFGNFKNVDEEIKLFFPDAADGAAVGTYKRINGIDNGSESGWKGSVTATVAAEADGTYKIYILGNTNAANRSLEITNAATGKSVLTQLSGEVTEYSTKNYMKVFSVEMELTKGDNELKLQAPSGGAAPNFIALLVTGEIAQEEQPTPTPTQPAVTPTATPAAPTATPTATPAAPTPEPYEIVGYTVEDKGDTALVKDITVRAEKAEGVKLYTAVYDNDGALGTVVLGDVAEAGESVVSVGAEADKTDTVKAFLWRDMEPLTAVGSISLTEEETDRITESFNRDWLFAYSDETLEAQAADYDDSGWADVALPHSFSIPYDLNQNSFYIGYGWYRKSFEIPADWEDKYISLDFEGVFQRAEIYVNGEYVPVNKVYGFEDREDEGATHEGGYDGFSVDITDYVRPGAENVIAVKADNIWQADLAPRGGDHQFSGGIYRDVTLTAVNKTHIDWYGTFVWTPAICNPAYQTSENRPDSEYKSDFERNGTGITNTLDDPNVEGAYVTEEEMLANLAAKTSDVEVQAEITNTNDKNISLYVKNTVKDAEGNVAAEFKSDTVSLAPGERKIVTARSERIADIKLWDFDNPNLYTALSEVYTAGGTRIDSYETEFGFRSAQFKLDGFYLNGKKTLLDGANVHQDHGGWADAVTNQGFYRDVKYVKETGFNFIRGSHYPHDPSFAEACDRLGVGFWSEGGLWSIGGFNDNDTVDMKPSDWMRGAYPLNGTPEELARFERSCYDLVGSMIRVNRNHPSVIVWSMGNEAFFSNDAVTDKVKQLVSGLRDYAHSLDYTRKAGLGGTQRKDLNVLAVCDVAGGNGDGGTAKYTNFYLPHLVAEYSSGQNDRPGAEDFQYDQIKDPADASKYVLPSQTITLADGTTAESASAGLSIWCMYHHGSVGGRALRIMGLMDYYRIPTTRYYMYRNDRGGREMPARSKEGTAAGILLEGSADITLDDTKTDKLTITNDGTSDIQLIATMVDENGEWVSDTRDMEIEVISGNGVFPTGKSYTFKAGKTIQDGRAGIEFRSYYSGETVIRASVPGTDIVSNTITVITENTDNINEGEEPEGFMTASTAAVLPTLSEPESYGKTDAAYNRQSRADSSSEDTIPYYAIDGDDTSYWQAGESDKQTWWVLTENSYYVRKVHAEQGGNAYPFTLYYQGAEDEWIKAADCDGTEPEIDLGGVYTGGIKLEFTDVPDGEFARLYSVNVYGTAFTGYAENSVYISDLTAQSVAHGWSGKTAGIDKSIEGKPITIGGTVYEKGLGLHADSEAVYELDGNYSRFTAVIGIDDEVGSYAEDGKDGAEFKIYATVKNSAGADTEMLIYDKTVTEAGVPETVDISVEGASKIRLVTDKVSNNSKDHTDWANPLLWGVLRDISVSDAYAVYAAKGASDGAGYEAYIRLVSNADISGEYTARLIFADADGNELDSSTSGLYMKDKKSVCAISADTVPAGCKYVSVEVLDAEGELIGCGLL